jgi:general secretion pathway protein C
MRLRLHPPAERLFRRLPPLSLYSAAELLLLILIAVQAVRLALSLATPVDPVGNMPAPAAAVPSPDSVLAEFDPFFRGSVGGDAAAAIDLKLYGVREDRATGGGSAIIALPDGTQRSFVVGEEIVPGVTLAAVGFDSATVNRNGAGTQIFLDQTRAPQAVGAGAAPAPAAAAQASAPVAPNPQIQFQERSSGGRVNGLAVSPGIDGGYALRAAGLEPGDVIVSINGQPVTSLDQARTVARRVRGEVPVIVNRGGRAVALRMSLDL